MSAEQPDLATFNGVLATIPADFRNAALRVVNDDGTDYELVAVRYEIRADGSKTVFFVVEG